MKSTFFSLLLAGVFIFQSCSKKSSESSEAATETQTLKIEKTDFGKLPDGQTAELYTLKNANGMEAKITNYGGIITHLTAPDSSGVFEDVVLGYDSLSGYLKSSPYFGAIVGRYGNRIAKGKFTLEGKTYTLAVNNMVNHLHGGTVGFDKVVWKAEPIEGEEPTLKLSYLSKDGEEGYPGNLNVTVTYTLQKNNSLKIDYTATTDKATVINLTNHTYFNLTGSKRDILEHQLTLNADRFLPVNETLIPTGELKPVAGNVFDFTKATAIGARINDPKDLQIKYGGGYDHCWVLNKEDKELSLAATVYEPTTGRIMEVQTTEPAIQFYTGNFLDGSITGKKGTNYTKRFAFCLETEHYPDSPNQSTFPTVVLKPGETYQTTTIYTFSAKK